MSEGAFLKPPRVDRGRHRYRAQTCRGQRTLDLLGGDSRIKRVVDIDDRQLAHLPGPFDRRKHSNRRPVSVRGVTIDELAKHPQTGTERELAPVRCCPL